MNLLNIPRHTRCNNCGQCCGIIPATLYEINAIRDYIAVNGILPIERSDKTICPFRDEKEKKCLIYPVRPIACRLFGVAARNMKCPNGNSAAIDGTKFLIDGEVRILNSEKW